MTDANEWPKCPKCQSELTDWKTWSPQPNDIARLDWKCHNCKHRWSMDVHCDHWLTEAYDIGDADDEAKRCSL